MQKFNISESKEIQDYYDQFGYVVIRNVIKEEKINTFISAYNAVKKNPFFVYYSQSLHISVRPFLNNYSYIKESMQNASRLIFFRNFSKSFQNCIYDENVSSALSTLTNEDLHISWQNMFFDQSTGTIEHQDSWYLDTEPSGNLIGVWYALENIHQDSGPFFVIPGSHKIGLIDKKDYPKHDDFVEVVKSKIEELGIQKKALCLNKGDILLWHPFLIHGAFDCKDKSKSRKSFTSHFYPAVHKAKNTESGKLISIYNHEKPKQSSNKKIHIAYRYNDYFYNILVYFLYIKNSIRKGKLFSMRREDYK